MYAIVKIAGQQFKATPNSILRVPMLNAEVGGSVKIDEVLLWSDEEDHRGGRAVRGRQVDQRRSGPPRPR